MTNENVYVVVGTNQYPEDGFSIAKVFADAVATRGVSPDASERQKIAEEVVGVLQG